MIQKSIEEWKEFITKLVDLMYEQHEPEWFIKDFVVHNIKSILMESNLELLDVLVLDTHLTECMQKHREC